MSAWQYDDGGRAASGRRGDAGDCVTRAIAIATGTDYSTVYAELADLERARGRARSARNGIAKADIRAYLAERGWQWVPCMSIGAGCTTHLRADELPRGRIIASLSRHVVAVIDGVVHDTHDPTRGGTRCVYGYWHRDA